MHKVYSAFDLPNDEGTINELPSRTQQHFADECDINKIMEKYEKTGCLIDPMIMPSRQPMFQDCSNTVSDYHEAQNTLVNAQNAFNELPAYVRKRFENEPANLIEFLSDSKNKKEAQDLGLVLPDPLPNPEPLPPTVPAAAKA